MALNIFINKKIDFMSETAAAGWLLLIKEMYGLFASKFRVGKCCRLLHCVICEGKLFSCFLVLKGY